MTKSDSGTDVERRIGREIVGGELYNNKQPAKEEEVEGGNIS